MGVCVVIRQSPERNAFRDVLLATASSPDLKTIVICSGFFQEGRGGFLASAEGRLARRLAASKARVIIVGIHSKQWYGEFLAFCGALKVRGVRIEARLVTAFHWHAKIFVASDRNGPVIGVVGSSNMTRPAFALSTPFNYESDVIMWRDRDARIGRLIQGIVGSVPTAERLSLRYVAKTNGGMSLRKRLERFQEDILGAKHKVIEI